MNKKQKKSLCLLDKYFNTKNKKTIKKDIDFIFNKNYEEVSIDENLFLKTDLIDLIQEKAISFDFVIVDFSNINNSKI